MAVPVDSAVSRPTWMVVPAMRRRIGVEKRAATGGPGMTVYVAGVAAQVRSWTSSA